MPRDILSDSLAVLSIVEHEDEDSWPLDAKQATKLSNKKQGNTPMKNNTKDDSACYYNLALGEGTNGANRQKDPVYQYKTSSLPASSSMSHTWDEVICSALRLSPEDIANQLTLLDLPCFKGIQAIELVTCGWNKLNKQTVAPNVVAFTKRFNRVSFWTVQEILNGETPKTRAETMSHFIKVGKKLLELNNLHSLFAIISALHSASVFRLAKTWAYLPKKDRANFEKMAELFSERENWKNLRDYLRSIALPCIPYLGIFLTDLVYIDLAHSAGMPHRAAKMAVVLKTIERYQSSEYEMAPLPNVARYLNSVRYIEELQKFLEDDQYKLSQKLEPPSPIGSCAGSKESVKETNGVGAVGPGGACSPHNLSPSHRLASGSLRVHGSLAQGQSKFIPTHRKCRSLGSNIFSKSHTEDKMDEKTPAGSVNLLDDTLLESPTVGDDKLSLSLPMTDPSKADACECEFEGFVRRKTVLKEGRKPSLASWQRYWLQISKNILILYASKSFKGTSRSDFRSERCKVVCLDGWRAAWLPGGPRGAAADAFQLTNHHTGTLYKFKTGSERTAKQWVTQIDEVTNKILKPLPANLMTFE